MITAATYHGMTCLKPSATVHTVIKNLSAAGSKMDPKTDFMLNRRAMKPSTASETHEYRNTEMAAVDCPVEMKYPINGVVAIRDMVKILGMVYTALDTSFFGKVTFSGSVFFWGADCGVCWSRSSDPVNERHKLGCTGRSTRHCGWIEDWRLRIRSDCRKCWPLGKRRNMSRWLTMCEKSPRCALVRDSKREIWENFENWAEPGEALEVGG